MNSHRNDRKAGKEQYYTVDNLTVKCCNMIKHLISDYKLIVEPCGGTGEFIDAIKNVLNKKSWSIDIDPKRKDIIKGDWLEVNESFDKPFAVITNPPYGRNHDLSVKFFNHSASLKADLICFLIPISWRKWSIQNRLNNNYHLILDKEITQEDMFYGKSMNNKKGDMRCIFQVWKKEDFKRKKVVIEDKGYLIRSTPLEADIQLTQQSYESLILEYKTNFIRKKVAGNFYFKIKNKEVLNKLKYIRDNKLFKEFTDNSMYFAKSISFNEINYLLNKL